MYKTKPMSNTESGSGETESAVTEMETRFVDIKESNGPDIDLFGYDAPVGMIIVRIDDMKVVHIRVDQIVQFTLLEHMIVSMMGE